MRRAVAALAALLLAAPGQGQVAAREPRWAVPYPADASVRPDDGYLYEAEEIAPRVYALQSPEPLHYQPLGNVTAIAQRDGFVLIDAGGTAAAAERVIALLRRIDPDLPVKAIVITHWHGDHVLGLRRLLAEWPNARTISTEATQRSLNDPDTLAYVPTEDRAATATMLSRMRQGADAFAQRAADETLPPEAREGLLRASRVLYQHSGDLASPDNVRIATTETFHDRLLLDDPEAPVELWFLGRANTDGDAVAWLPRQRVLVTGDIVVAPMPYGFSSFPADWLETIARLKAFDFALLVPGHGRPMRDAAYLDRLAALIADLRAQVGPIARQGLPLDEVRRRVDFSAQRAIFAGTDRWRRFLFDAYWVEPIVRSAWLEARGEPIVQGEHP